MAQDNTIPHGKPGIASFESETWGNRGEPRFGDGIARTVTRVVTAGADLDLPLYSVISFIDGILALAVSGTAGGSASGTITLSSTGPVDTETVTIAGVEYTFVTALTDPAEANEVVIGGTINDTAANLADAVNADADAIGTTVGTGTVINPDVRATVSGAVVTIIARDAGDEGNAITLAEAASNVALSGATLTGGDDDIDVRPYGITASPVVLANGESMSIPIYVDGHWNMDALTWDSTYATDEQKERAFEGSINPGILISKPKYNSDGIPV